MHTRRRVHRKRSARFFIVQRQPHLVRHSRNIPIECTLQSLLLEQHGVQRLRQSSNIVQRRLCDFPHFLQVLPQRRSIRRLPPQSSQQGTDRRQHLAKLVVQLP